MPPTTYSVFGDRVPATPSAADDRSVEIGVELQASSPGWITGIRFYQGPGNVGPHSGTLWSATGTVLSRATFPDHEAGGWREAPLDTPVPVTSGTTYVASYHAPQGHYAADAQAMSPDKPVTTGALTARQGVFNYGDGAPTSLAQGFNYYVDVVFTTAPPPLSTPGNSSTPTPAAASTLAPPAARDKPGPDNTGVPAGTSLTRYTGPMTITTAGTVIDAKDVTGALVIKAKNVVIRNSKIHDDPGAVAGVYVTDSGSATITDSEIYNFQVGITYSNWTAIRVNLHDLTFDGMKIGSDVKLQDSWVHDPRPTSDAHWDGGQVQAGVTNTVIQGNNIDVGNGDANTALFLTPDLGPSSPGPLTVRRNWLNGGNFTLAVLDGDGGKYFIAKIEVSGNRFGRSARYGPANVKVPVVWSNNVWDDTGAVVGR